MPGPTPLPTPQPKFISDEEMNAIDSSVEVKEAKKIVAAESRMLSFLPKSVDPLDFASRVAKDIPAHGAAALRGVERSVTDIAPGALENIEAAGVFIPTRVGEAAARLFVDDEKQPKFTSFGDLVQQRYGLTKELRQRAPGVEQGAEYGAIAGSVAKLATQLPKFGSGLLTKFLAKRSANQTKKLARKLLAQGEGPILDAIVERPERVLELVKGGKLSVDDLTISIGDELARIEKELGKSVQAFRGEALQNTDEIIDVSDALGEFLKVKEATQARGISLLPSKGQADINLLQKLLSSKESVNNISPSDLMKIVDKIDDMGTFKNQASGNITREGVNALKNLRRSLKEKLRAGNEEWARADDLFSQFKDKAEGVVRKFSSSNSKESFVNNLFGKNKTFIRDDLVNALDLAEKIDPKRIGNSAKFLNELANIKAAQGVQAVKLEITDPIADRVNRIVARWTTGGAAAGAAVGAKVAPLVGISPIVGAAGGSVVGGFGGRQIGIRFADPLKVLKAAKKAKELSKEARLLASDMVDIVGTFGVDGAEAIRNMIGPIPAMVELSQWITPPRDFAAQVAGEK